MKLSGWLHEEVLISEIFNHDFYDDTFWLIPDVFIKNEETVLWMIHVAQHTKWTRNIWMFEIELTRVALAWSSSIGPFPSKEPEACLVLVIIRF